MRLFLSVKGNCFAKLSDAGNQLLIQCTAEVCVTQSIEAVITKLFPLNSSATSGLRVTYDNWPKSSSRHKEPA